MTTAEFEIRTLEDSIKRIFYKKEITQEDVALGNRFIAKWKLLTGWIERTELPIKLNNL
jgi:hypothetical protein